MKHPIQPLEFDERGTLRFKTNKLVRHLLDHGGFDMNAIGGMTFSNEDRQQFAQLTGYSLNGYGELPYVDDETYCVAAAMSHEKKSEVQARVEYLEKELKTLRDALRKPMANLFGVHPDDLKKHG